jgi:N6-adenosine-specific RNA methylase IME4
VAYDARDDYEKSCVVATKAMRAAITLPGKVSRIGWVVPAKLTSEQWHEAMQTISDIEGSIMWVLGDGWRAGEERKEYGAGEETATTLGLNYDTCRNAAWVAGRIELSRRRDNLSFGHHQAVAPLDPYEQDRFLDAAEKDRCTVKDIRTTVAKYRRAKKHQEIADAARAKQDILGPFPLIYADPPWSFETYSELGKELSPDEHYPVMSYEDIKALTVDGKPISELAHADAALFLWCTSSNIHLALEVMGAWGFEYKTHAVWDKQRTGTGYIFLNQHEVLLYGTRGGMPAPLAITSSVFSVQRTTHSAKPPEVRAALDRMYPEFDGAMKVELFCREEVPGWTTWGYES